MQVVCFLQRSFICTGLGDKHFQERAGNGTSLERRDFLSGKLLVSGEDSVLVPKGASQRTGVIQPLAQCPWSWARQESLEPGPALPACVSFLGLATAAWGKYVPAVSSHPAAAAPTSLSSCWVLGGAGVMASQALCASALCPLGEAGLPGQTRGHSQTSPAPMCAGLTGIQLGPGMLAVLR